MFLFEACDKVDLRFSITCSNFSLLANSFARTWSFMLFSRKNVQYEFHSIVEGLIIDTFLKFI